MQQNSISALVRVLLLTLGIPCIPQALHGEVFPTKIESILYPPLAQQALIVGDVELDVAIDPSGEVSRVKVISSSHRLLAEAAESAIKRWRFAPRCPEATGPQIETTARFQFTFRLEGVVMERPRTVTSYVFPGRVTIVGEKQHYQPAAHP